MVKLKAILLSLVLAGALSSDLEAQTSGQRTEIVKRATVTAIRTFEEKSSMFSITTSGGEGECKDKRIYFVGSNYPDPAEFQRAFAVALTAFVSGMKVSVMNFNFIAANGCGGHRIELTR